MKVDFLIHGAGLAGIMLGHFLSREGASVAFSIHPSAACASLAAAGLANPVGGKRFAPTWRYSELLEFADTTYRTIAADLWRRPRMLRILNSDDERHRWLARFPNALIRPEPVGIRSCAGMTEIEGAAVLDVGGFVARVRAEFAARTVVGEASNWFLNGSYASERSILCTGFATATGPFNGLPFQPSKGETLTLEFQGLDNDAIFVWGNFLVPIHGGKWIAGTTYDRNDLSADPTEQSREALLRSVRARIDRPFRVLEHRAGIRVSPPDRRPILGPHPAIPGLNLFTGLGSRGVLLAPFYAAHLAKHLVRGSPLDPDIDLRRFGDWTQTAHD